MIRFVGLLRGVNVGGHNKLPMASLRDALDKTSFQSITTYIQTGNIVFSSKLEEAECEQIISEVLKSDFDLEAPVIVREQSYFETVLKANPFKTRTIDNSKSMSFGFLSEIPAQDKITVVEQMSSDLETFKIVDDVLYFYCGISLADTKFTNTWFEKKLGVISTMRNYNTTLKLTQL
ncbi:DUF1697 domain-containing protein [Nonlabens antarcticus]|uniref:DUF1697 domain-containing protein n=1 Tax=Nonlabens antarcticus TaxID=392714 RepID=UPI0018917552|nr:DUF1697 domain-containing protein [Nonlabens antarcticus]